MIVVLQVYPDFVHYLLDPRQISSFHEMYDPANRRVGMREADTNMMMFGYYIWNNVRIGFQTFAGGLLAGVGSAWFLGSNGVIIGAVAGYLTQAGYSETFWSFVAGHSSLELLAIVLSGAAGFKLGMAVIAPGNRSRKAALMAAARPAVRIMYGAAIMFFAAAFVEAFWSPHYRSSVQCQDWRGHRRLGDAARLLPASPGARVQAADIAIGLRRRSPWEAMDLGLTMLQRWWRQVYAAASSVCAPADGRGARGRVVVRARVGRAARHLVDEAGSTTAWCCMCCRARCSASCRARARCSARPRNGCAPACSAR